MLNEEKNHPLLRLHAIHTREIKNREAEAPLLSCEIYETSSMKDGLTDN